MPSRMLTWMLVCGAVGSVVSGPTAAAAERRPNVLLIMTDDQGYGDFSLHGNPHLRTPNIDRLAQAGVQFERFFVNSFCAPTRAALLTGRYPLRCGVWGVTHNKEAMRLDEVTLAEALRGEGYRTACIGKWHNGEQFPYTAPGQGFEQFFGFHNGHWNNYFDPALLRGSQPVATRGYITDVLTDEALRFVREHRDGPFFCYLAFNAPHSPFQVPDPYFDRFRKDGVSATLAAFYGMCANVDDNVGRVLGLLDELKIADDTIVIFLTDNGGTAGVTAFNAGMRGGKTSVHEGGSRVPLFVRWPKRLQPRVVPQIAAHIDLYPTVLDLCGVAPPPGPPVDGVSLRPLLESRTIGWPDRVLFMHNPISTTNRYPGAVRTQRYRLVREIRDGAGGGSRAKANDALAGPWQLYDMSVDPGERNDLASVRPTEVEKYGRLYEKWFDDVSRGGLRRFPLPVGHPEENPVTLHAPQAFFDGSLKFFAGPGFAHDWLTNWIDPQSKITFELDVAREGAFEVSVRYACPQADAGARMLLSIGDVRREARVPPGDAPTIPLPHRDGGKSTYVDRRWAVMQFGRYHLAPGATQLTLQALDKPGSQVLEFKGVELRRVETP